MSFTYRRNGTNSSEDQKPYLLMNPAAYYCGSFATPVASGMHAITGLGFQPDCIVLMCDSYYGVTSQEQGRLAWGCATSSAFGQQWTMACAAAWLTNPPRRAKVWRKGNCLTAITPSGSEEMLVTLNSFDADGFTLNFNTVAFAGRPVQTIYYLAMQGDFRAGTINTGEDISGAPFAPKGVWLASAKGVSPEVTAGNGYQMAQGFAGWEGGQACVNGAAVDDSEMTSGGIFCSGYYSESYALVIIRPTNGFPVDSPPTHHDVVRLWLAKVNGFTGDGVSFVWTEEASTNPNPLPVVNYEVGYLLVGGDAEAGAIEYASWTDDPTDFETQPSRMAPTAMLSTSRGIAADPTRHEWLYGATAELGLGAANLPYGWLDADSSHPAEEFYCTFGEGGGGFGSGGGFQTSNSREGSYWQGGTNVHGSEEGWTPKSKFNVVSVTPGLHFNIVDMNWRSARRQHGRLRTPAKGGTAG